MQMLVYYNNAKCPTDVEQNVDSISEFHIHESAFVKIISY